MKLLLPTEQVDVDSKSRRTPVARHRSLQPRSTATRLCNTVVEDWVYRFRLDGPQLPDDVDVG